MSSSLARATAGGGTKAKTAPDFEPFHAVDFPAAGGSVRHNQRKTT
jgi:hypothetical protein